MTSSNYEFIPELITPYDEDPTGARWVLAGWTNGISPVYSGSQQIVYAMLVEFYKDPVDNMLKVHLLMWNTKKQINNRTDADTILYGADWGPSNLIRNGDSGGNWASNNPWTMNYLDESYSSGNGALFNASSQWAHWLFSYGAVSEITIQYGVNMGLSPKLDDPVPTP